MRPEGASRKGGGERADLRGHVFPLGDWGEPAERLDEMYVWVEQRALVIADRHLADRVRKRRAARTMRACAALSATASAVIPLLALTGTLPVRCAPWGYLALLCAVVCVAGDRCFGLTSGWMRDLATALAIQRRLESLQFDWASEAVREVLGPTDGSAAEAAERGLVLLRGFTEDVSEIVRAETADWMHEFGPAPSHLRLQSACPRPAARPAEEQQQLNGQRANTPPGFRPSMPRQRPPEDLR